MVKNDPTKDTYLEIKEKVNQKILNFISYKLRSKREISERLKKYLSRYKKINQTQKDSIIEELLSHLKEIRLIDDLYFAENFVMQKVRSPKPVSKMQVKQFLIKKGVSGKVIQQALKKYSDDEETTSIMKDAKKKLNSVKSLQKLQKKKRLYDFLARKGYPYTKIRSAVDRVLEVE